MKHGLPLAIALLAATGLAACSDDDDDGDLVDFGATVADLIQNQTTETGDPIEVGGTAFVFDEDPAAFDALLPPDTGPVVGP